MSLVRNQPGYHTGSLPAVVFNVLLFLIPIFSVQVLSGVLNDSGEHGAPTAELIDDTRRAIDKTFVTLAPASNSARANWAALVDVQLAAKNTPAARGFLLAAPQLLNRDDARAIRAAASDEPAGSADQRLLRAALLFLPNEVRNGYLKSARPKGIELITASAETVSAELPSTQASNMNFPGLIEPVALTPIEHMTRSTDFNVLGTPQDLANNSRAWLRGDRRHTTQLKLTGLAMAADPEAIGVSQTRLQQAASVLKTSLKARRLDQGYASNLENKIDAVFKNDVLEFELDNAFAEISTPNVQAMRVREAFSNSIDASAASRLTMELNQIGRLVDVTGPLGALSLLEHAKSARDVSKARLIAEAGGDRSVALTTVIGAKTLSLGGVSFRWSQRTILLFMALAAASVALILVVMSSTLRMMFGRSVTAIL
ncbi:MAG: hypothetical protein AAF950_01180 [Pseudomonadota bacterium]